MTHPRVLRASSQTRSARVKSSLTRIRNGRIAPAVLLLLSAATVQAKHMYQYTDAQGIVHFTDVKPGDDIKDVKSTRVRTDAEPLVRTREEGLDADRTLVFVNTSGGAVTVELDLDEARNVRSEPQLPARIVLAPRSDTRAVRIIAQNPSAGFAYTFRYRYIPGDFRAKPDENAIYRLPFAQDQRFRIAQAFGGKVSHADVQNYYAVDIGMPEGTPVLAARDGVVMTVDNDFFGAGLDMAKYGDRANNVRIVHVDGTMAVYAHLELESVRVHVGDRVRAGQMLGLSGDTGYTNGPHLHFCVQRNANMALVSVPFQFSGTQGAFTPVAGMSVGGD
jgi:murein DD-endopeptidase MepM/ murein hydrolase activator NlpD